MKKLGFLFTILAIHILLSKPPDWAQARNLSAVIHSQQKAQITIDPLINTNSFDLLNQEPQPTPTAINDQGQSSSQTIFKIYMPAMISAPPADIFYVALSGSDSNPGTFAQPWRSIQKAANTLTAGQTVKIMPGTYYAKFAPQKSGTANGYITYTADPGTVILDGSGVSLSSDIRGDGLVQILGKSYIKIQNLTVRDATVNCVNISDNSSGTRSSYIEVTGLNIQNCTQVGIRARATDHVLIKDNVINHISYSSGIGVWFATYATVDHNTITNAHYYHECQGAHDEALTIATVNHFEVKNNTLDNTEPNPAGFCANKEKLGIDVKESSQNGMIYGNSIKHMTTSSIYMDGWHAGANGTPTLNHINIFQNIITDSGGIAVGCEQADGVVEYINIYNNVIINSSFSGIQVRGAYGDGLRKNINIYNNTIYGALLEGGNGGAGIYITTANLGSNNADAPVIVRNNISMFYFLSTNSGTMGQIVAANAAIASKITADHNLVSGPQKCSLSYPSCSEVGSRVSAAPNPVFKNPAAFDLHLTGGSPAIDSGAAMSIVSTDFDGLPRPLPAGHFYDIGAYEYK